MSIDDLDDDLPENNVAVRALPFVTTVVAFAVGALVGGVILFFFSRGQELVEVSRDLSNEEIEAICAPKVAEATGEIESAQQKVRTLEAQVDAKQAEVARLESEMESRAKKGSELVASLKAARVELKAAQAELQALEAELDSAIAEKDQLVVDLYKTEVALEAQVALTESAKEEGVIFKWRSFVGLAQLQVCEKGGRRKMGRCRETVSAALDTDVRSQFEHCLRAGQETPSVRLISKGDDLPPFSVWVDQDQRQTRGWYVRLCDPTLPEAQHFEEVDMDKATGKLGE